MTDDKIVHLVPLGDARNEDIISWLETLLENAKAGEIRAIAFVAMRSGDSRKWWFCAKPPLGNALLGAVGRLHGQLAYALDQEVDC